MCKVNIKKQVFAAEILITDTHGAYLLLNKLKRKVLHTEHYTKKNLCSHALNAVVYLFLYGITNPLRFIINAGIIAMSSLFSKYLYLKIFRFYIYGELRMYVYTIYYTEALKKYVYFQFVCGGAAASLSCTQTYKLGITHYYLEGKKTELITEIFIKSKFKMVFRNSHQFTLNNTL